MARIQELEKQILLLNNAYYNQDAPVVSDYEYDKLLKELKRLKPNSEVFSDLGQAVWGTKVKHSSPMGSLIKAHTAEEILKMSQEKFLCVMPKIDGCSLSIKYSNGRFKSALTRGDGYEGEDVTENVKQIKNVPKTIDHKGDVEVRGEVYVDNKWFYKNQGDFKNPRNYAAGSLKQKDAKVTGTRNLSFVAYRFMNGCKSKSEELIKLSEMGFEVLVHDSGNSEKFVKTIIEEFTQDRKDFHYDVDGIVFWLDDKKEFESKGLQGITPKGAIAYKFDTDKVSTIVEDIEWNTSRTGKVVPVMHIKEVQVAGTSVRRVTLNNPDFIKRNDIAIGDTILIEKANEIIPKLVSVVSRPKGRYLNVPKKCPTCKFPLVEKGAYIICKNPNCSAQEIENLLYFIRHIDMKGFSISAVEKIIESDILNNKNIFQLTEKELLSIGFGPTQSSSFVELLKNIKLTEVEFFKALGIEKAGTSAFEKVLENFTFDDIINMKFTYEKLLEIVGPATAQAILEGLADKVDFIGDILPFIKILKKEKISSTSQKLDDKSFCITGTLSKKRAEIENIIEANGGKISSVSKNLDYLVVGTDPGSKLTRAQSLGVKIIDENKFREMIK